MDQLNKKLEDYNKLKEKQNNELEEYLKDPIFDLYVKRENVKRFIGGMQDEKQKQFIDRLNELGIKYTSSFCWMNDHSDPYNFDKKYRVDTITVEWK